MKTISTMILALLLAGLLLVGSGCVLEEKVIELIITGDTCADFPENHDSASWNTPKLVNYAAQIDQILADNDLDRSDIKEAKVKSATYTVTAFSHTHDWDIGGTITVTREDQPDGPEVLVTYTDQSIQDALDEVIYADLNRAGVEIMNQALVDYIDNDMFPVLTFEVVNDAVDPVPTSEDRLVFTWEACIQLHIVVEEDVELPDWP
jgi:hypothetical protein